MRALIPALLIAGSGFGQPLATVVEAVRANVNGNEALEFVARQHETDRWFTFPKFQQTADYLERTMRQIGLAKVERGSAPADGVTQFGFWTMPLAWDVTSARLELIESEPRVLADYSKEPASLVMWSGATPPGGVVAGVVEWRPGVDVKGRMVLTEAPLDLSQRGALKASLYQAGAAGMISYATESPSQPDGHYWINAWGDHGWGFTKTSSPLVGFSITPRQGAYLRDLLRHGVGVRVKAVANTRYYSGRYPWVTAVIPGSGSDQEVLELGHAFETGAQDNSTGVAAMLEAAATLTRLIEAGKLARPRRSIRVLVMPEDYGSAAYIAGHMERMQHTIGAINMDVPAGPYDEVGAYNFAMNPDVSRSYQDALILRVAETYYAAIPGRVPRAIRYRPTSDSYLSDPMIGVPTVAANSSSSAHHNSADTLDRVDPRSLRDLSAIVAAYLYYLASAGPGDVAWLAGITLERIAARSEGIYDSLAKVDYNADRDREALLSLRRLAPHADLAAALERLDRIAADHSARLRAAGQAGSVKPPPDPRRAEAAKMVVKRKRFGPVTLDDLPVDRREGFPGFAGKPAPLQLVGWCDSKRTLAEVIRLVELELGPMDFDFVGYFKMLARHGYVELK